jgi:hypothetical protein
MLPSPWCISYLATHPFIRNHSAPHLFSQSYWKDTNFHVWYCVGIIEGKRYVHCIRMLKKTPKPGITSYFIEWFNTAPYSNSPLSKIPKHFDSCCFWVHSGVALRKNLFLFQDRMSFIRSTFYYDSETCLFYRMSLLITYLDNNEAIPTQLKIFTSVEKWYIYQKRIKKRKYDDSLRKKNDCIRNLKKFIEHNNHHHFLEETYPKLFEEAQLIVSKHGNST